MTIIFEATYHWPYKDAPEPVCVGEAAVVVALVVETFDVVEVADVAEDAAFVEVVAALVVEVPGFEPEPEL